MVEKRGEEGSVEAKQDSKEQVLEDTGKNKKNKKNKKIDAKTEQANSKKELSENTTKKIGYLISKSQVQEEELYQLVKDFFKDYLKLDYEFTHEELMEELKTVYLEKELLDELESFLKKIAKIECFDNNFSNAEMKSLIEKFEEISKQIIGPLEKQEEYSMVKKLLSSVKGSVKQAIKRENKEEKSKIAQKEESLQALKSEPESESTIPVEEETLKKQKDKSLKRKAKAVKKKKASGKVKKSKTLAKAKTKAKTKPKKKSQVKKTTKKNQKTQIFKKAFYKQDSLAS